jgi:hypothetical protein
MELFALSPLQSADLDWSSCYLLVAVPLSTIISTTSSARLGPDKGARPERGPARKLRLQSYKIATSIHKQEYGAIVSARVESGSTL